MTDNGATAIKRGRMEDDKPSQRLKSWSRSKSTFITLEHIWIIENFSRLPHKTGECKESPIFSDLSEKKVEWKLQLYPKGDNHDSKHFIGIFLSLHNPQPDFKHNVNFQLTILNKSQTILKQIGMLNINTEFNGQGNKAWGHGKLMELNQITPTSLPGDELHVKCEVTYAISQTSLSGLLLLPFSSSGNCSEHLKQLFERKLLTDVVIHVKDEKFDAHKLILSARSQVFLAMFQSDLTEAQSNTIKIEDIKPAVFKEVLRFIYTDQVEQLDEIAEELLAVAERYMLELLKSKCESHLARKITVENCVDFLLLADLHSAVGLKTFVLDFFRLRAAEVAQTASWQQLMHSANPLLFRDISKALIPQVRDQQAATPQ
jgi:speckle-type POZ protein